MPSKKGQKHLTGIWDLVIMKGNWSSKIQFRTKCRECGTMIGYYSEKRWDNHEKIRCHDCLQKAINAIPSTHTQELSS